VAKIEQELEGTRQEKRDTERKDRETQRIMDDDIRAE
jgi:hypothetical protein